METEILNISNKNDFTLWLENKYSSQKISNLLSAVEDIEEFCKKINILKHDFFEINSLTKFNKIKTSINGNRFFKNNHKGKMPAILGVLSEYNKYLVEKKPIEKVDKKNTNIENENLLNYKEKIEECYIVNFDEKISYSYTKPIVIKHKEYECKVKNWCNLYTVICNYFYNKHREVFLNFSGKSLNAENGRIDFGYKEKKETMVKPRLISENFYIETNLSADQIIDKIKRIISLCNESLNDVVIKYIKTKDQENTKEKNDEISEIKNNLKTDFYKWMVEVEKIAEATSRSYYSAIKTISKFGIDWGILEDSLFEIKNKNLIYKIIYDIIFNDERFIKLNNEYRHRFKAALKKYYSYISDGFEVETINKKESINKNIDKYEILLSTKFKNGFRLNSVLETKKLLKFYENEFLETPIEKDEEIQEIIKTIGIENEGRVYYPDSMIDKELKDNIIKFIENLFNNDASLIYYDSIYKEYETFFHVSNIYNVDMLKLYLEYFLKEKYNFENKYISKMKNLKVNPVDEVKDFMKSSGSVVSCQYLEENLPQIPLNKIKQIFSNNKEFIYVKKDNYIHIDNIHFSDEDIENIKIIISDTIKKDGFISGNELISIITKVYPKIIEKNSIVSDSSIAIRDAIKYHLSDIFSFNGNIISDYDSNFSMADIFSLYCKKHEFFTIDMLNILKNELGSTIYFYAVYDNSLRINENEFISKDKINFDVKAIDEVIKIYCPGDYITINSIKQFGLFPGISYPWNSYLLEHYIYSYSLEFKLLNASSFSVTKCNGVIVKRNSIFKTFDDVISDAIAKSGINLNKKDVLDFLCENGFIGKRNFSNIEKIINNAKLQRNQ